MLAVIGLVIGVSVADLTADRAVDPAAATAAATQVNQRAPGTISLVSLERLRAKADLADIRLALCRSPDFELSLLAEMQWSIDQLTDEVIDLRHQIDAKSAADLGPSHR
jgi:outer membrane receptor for ferrienterochelin and colicin